MIAVLLFLLFALPLAAGNDNVILHNTVEGDPTTPIHAIPVHRQFWLGELRVGDVGWFAIKRFQGQGLHPSLPVPAVNTPQNLATVTTTSMCAESSTGHLWLEIMSDNMIPLEQDGMGQAILVDF